MGKVVWKAFTLGSFLEYSSKHCIKSQIKELHVYKEYQRGTIANVTASKENNGIVGYIEENEEIKEKKVKNILTIVPDSDGGAGVCFYQKDYVVSTGHNKVIEINNEKLKKVFYGNAFAYEFLAKIVTKNFYKTCYGFNKSINVEDFNKTYILLPCLEVKKDDEYIWEEDNKYYTLAVDYIKKLMDKAKELKEQKTIRYYEKEKAKYEKEKAKYEKAYLEEKKNVVWKNFALNQLFRRSTPPSTNTVAKDLTIYDDSSDERIPLITRAETNNGIKGYIYKNNYNTMINKITYNDQFSFFKYHDYEFTTIKDHLSVIDCVNQELQKILDNNHFINFFLVGILNHIYSKKIFSFNFTGADYRFDREIVLLPFLKTNEENQIYSENDKYYTLATNYISYIYLQGRCNYYQKLIDEYTYKY